MENNEKLDWKPEVGKHVWVVENYMILQKKVLRVDPSLCCLLRGRRGDDFYEGFKCYPTPEAALASIKIYDLEGKEVVIPPRPLVLEPKPLEWRKNTNDFNEHLCEDDYWTFSANSDGSWVIFHGNAYMGGEDNPTDGLSIDDAKAAIHEWRVNHLKSMLP